MRLVVGGGAFGRRGADVRGLTLVELLVAMAILSILLGAGFALLRNIGRSTELAASERSILALVQRARSQALTQDTHVEIGFEVLTPGGRVFSYLRQPITHFHFEDDLFSDTVRGTGGVYGRLNSRATLVQMGRTGQGLQLGATRHVPSGAGERVAYMEITETDSRFDCPQGVHLRCDVRVDDFSRDVDLIRRGRNYFFGITRDRSDHRLYLYGGGDFEGTIRLPRWHEDAEPVDVEDSIMAVALEPLPTRRWVTVEMIFDDRGVRFFVDGRRQLSYVPAHEEASQVERMVGLARDRLGRYSRGREPEPGQFIEYDDAMPETYDPATRAVWAYFAPNGGLDPIYHTRPVHIYLERPQPTFTSPFQETSRSTPDRFRLIAPRFDQGEVGTVHVGRGLLGRMDNVALFSIESGQGFRLPQGLLVTPQSDPNAEERRQITIDPRGNIR